MALMMVFSKKTKNMCGELHGFDCYQTDNIYQFLKYANEAKPDVVMMHFEKNFNVNTDTLNEIKKALCSDDVCPRILLNLPTDFSEELFYENVDFEKDDIKKYLN